MEKEQATNKKGKGLKVVLGVALSVIAIYSSRRKKPGNAKNQRSEYDPEQELGL